MQNVLLLCLFVMFSFFISCKNAPQEKPAVAITTPQKPDEVIVAKKDTITQPVVQKALTALKNKDYKAFASLIHPKEGVRFSPYGYIDTLSDRKFTPEQFTALMSDAKKPILKWGSYDGTGDVIKLTAEKYFKIFVYNADFLNAPSNTLNKKVSEGNSTNNIADIYKNCQFSESYIPATDKVTGMNWAALRLVFKQLDGKWYVVGVVNDRWTT